MQTIIRRTIRYYNLLVLLMALIGHAAFLLAMMLRWTIDWNTMHTIPLIVFGIGVWRFLHKESDGADGDGWLWLLLTVLVSFGVYTMIWILQPHFVASALLLLLVLAFALLALKLFVY